MAECTKWAQKKAEAFQANEAQCHKRSMTNEAKQGPLRVGDTVVVHATAFKGPS